MMNIAGCSLKDTGRAEEIYKKALVSVKDEKKREMIERTFYEIIEDT